MAKTITTSSGLMLYLLSMSTIFLLVYGDSFQCPGEGVFRKRDSCREYYTCIIYAGKFYKLLEACPDSQIFNDAEQRCVLNSHLSSPHDCLQGSHREDSTEDQFEKLKVLSTENPTESLDRINNLDSTGISDTSPKHLKQTTDVPGNETDDGSTLDEAAKDVHPQPIEERTKAVVRQQPNVAVDANVKTLSLCDLKNITDAYFTLAIGSPPLHQVSGNQAVYNRNIMQYNKDITQAQENAYLWRRSIGTPHGLRQSHKKANEYKNNFQKKLAIYKEQIQIISSHKISLAFIRRLEGEIKNHNENIRRAQATLNITLVPEIRDILEQIIDTNRKEIERIQLQTNPNSELLLLRELVTFITLVRNDASEVQSLARQTLRKMASLLENMSIDEHNYVKLDVQANDGIKTLTEEATGIWQELVSERKTEVEKLGDLIIKSSKICEEIRVITKTIDDFLRKKKILCIPSRMVGAFGRNLTCDDVIRSLGISLDLDAENNRLQELRREMEMIQANQSIALEELKKPTPIRTALFDETWPKQRRLELTEFELYNLQFHSTHLQQLKTGVAAARNSILQLQEESQELRKNFESLVKELQDKIDAANTAITDGIQTGVRETIEKDLENLLITLQNQKLNNINKCFTI